MDIVWKQVKGFPEYKVNNFGEIVSTRSGKEVKIKLFKTRDGYLCLSLKSSTDKKHTSAHRLVAIAFLDNPENKPCVNHINGIKHDNKLENLEWCTHKENREHAIRTGLVVIDQDGEKNPCSELTAKQVKAIYESTKGMDYLANKYKTTYKNIYAIKREYNWSSVTNGAVKGNSFFKNDLSVTYNGQTKNLSQWASDLKISYTTLYFRYCSRWDTERMLTKSDNRFKKLST